jgi:hypothetical protein
MSRDPRVDELLAPLREGASEPGRLVEIDRDRTLARMSAAAKSASLERVRPRRSFGLLAVAAGFAVIVGGASLRIAAKRVAVSDPSLSITAIAGEVTLDGPAPRSIAAGQSASVSPDGDLATAPDGQAHIKAPSGLEVDVFGGTRVALANLQAGSSTVRLSKGALRCRVPHLDPKETFSVSTPDARVVVHGTVFSVEVASDGASTRTTVRVEEGVVVVQHGSDESTLTASQGWTSSPPAESSPRSSSTIGADPKSADETIPKERTAPGRSWRRGPEPATPASGTLDQETQLLRSGLAAERKGELTAAAASFELLLSRHPQSPLRPDALAALARVRARQAQAR